MPPVRLESTLDTPEPLHTLVNRAPMVLLYVSRPGCSVCTALSPKVHAMLAEFPEIERVDIDLSQTPELAGPLTVFTIPAILVYAEGRELAREARYLSIPDLADRLRRPYRILYPD